MSYPHEDPRITNAEIDRDDRTVDDYWCDKLDREEERRIYGE